MTEERSARKPFVLAALRRWAKIGLPASSRLLRLVYPPNPSARRYWNGVARRSDGLLMKVDTRKWIEREVLFAGTFEPHLSPIFDANVRAGDVVLDIGANVGVHTLTLARLVGPSGAVIAYEPNPQVAADLRSNLALNGLRNAVVKPVAVGDVAGTVTLRIPLETSAEGGNAGLASIDALETPHRTVDAPVVTIDDDLAAETRRITVVKIDVQGYEPRALMGMRSMLERHRPKIVFEFDPWTLEKTGFDTDWLWNFFEERRYVLVDPLKKEKHVIERSELRAGRLSEILALPA